MLTKTSRAIRECSCHSVTSGARPDARVPRAASTPITSTTWCGFGRIRRQFTARKLVEPAARARGRWDAMAGSECDGPAEAGRVEGSDQGAYHVFGGVGVE